MEKYLMQNGNKFIASDSNSGGYPWETDYIQFAKTFDDPAKLMQWVGDDYPNGKVMKLEYVLTEVAKPDLEEKRKEAALAKLTSEERELLGLR